MINFVKGTLIENNIGQIVVENNGIGYEIFVPQKSLMPEVGEDVFIYTYFAVREDNMSLYGFTSKEDKDIFLKLISVNGVGPKNALNIISDFGRENLMLAIVNEDKKSISQIKGIGEKTAGRIIIDLKDKLDLTQIKNANVKIITNQNMSDKMKNVVEALVSLGYQKTKAKDVVLNSNLNDDYDEDEMLKIVLKNM